MNVLWRLSDLRNWKSVWVGICCVDWNDSWRSRNNCRGYGVIGLESGKPWVDCWLLGGRGLSYFLVLLPVLAYLDELLVGPASAVSHVVFSALEQIGDASWVSLCLKKIEGCICRI